MDVIPFIATAVSLLAVPGPTNTLLATSGAVAGFSRSLPLLAAELAGYLVAILLLRSLLGPLMAAVPMVAVGLRIAVTIYLVYLAVMLWRYGTRALRDQAPVTFRRVLVTTLLNPKAIIFAFTLLPLQAGMSELLPRLAILALQIVTIGGAWIVLGASLGRGLQTIGQAGLIYRFSAIALVVLAGLIGVRSLGFA